MTEVEAVAATKEPRGSTKGRLPAGMFPGGVDIYGDSLAIGFGGSYPLRGWMHRLATLLGAPMRTRGGSVGQVDHSWARVLQDYSVGVKHDRTPARCAWPAGERLVGIGFGFNDLGLGGEAAIPPFLSAMRGMISRTLTWLVREDKGLSLSGPNGSDGWSRVASTARNSGDSYWETAVDGARFTYVTGLVLPGTVYAVGGPVLAGTTGYVDITLDGVPHGTVDLSAAAPLAAGRYGMWCHRLDDIPPHSKAGAHEITGTVRELGVGAKASIDFCNVEAASPPVVLVKNVVRPHNTEPRWARTVADRDADIAALNLRLETLCDEFRKPGLPNSVLYLDFDSAIDRGEEFFMGSVDENGALLDDGLHFNDEGYALLTGVAYEALRDWSADFDPVAAARLL